MTDLTTTKVENPPSLAYNYKDALYLNITSKCPTACEFCIKFSWDYMYRGNNLLLKSEPSVEEILAVVDDPSKYSEIVFCGYGESTYRLDVMKRVSEELRKNGAKNIRLNTIGLGSLIHGRNIVPDLAQIVDSISISLNVIDPTEWNKIHKPQPQYKEKGYQSVLEFIQECAKVIPDTQVSSIETIEKNRLEFEKLVNRLGAKIKSRSYLDEYESS